MRRLVPIALTAVDLAGYRLFVNAVDNGATEVIDFKAGKLVRTIAGMHESKWIVFRPELHKLYGRAAEIRSYSP